MGGRTKRRAESSFFFLFFLDEIGDIHGHLLHRGVVEGLDVSQGALVVLCDHVDGNALPAKTTAATDPWVGRRKKKKNKISI